MLDNVIKKNEGFLRLCCSLCRFFALLLFLGAIVVIMLGLAGMFWPIETSIETWTRLYRLLAPMLILKIVFPALLLIGIEQLIKCLLEVEFKPNWILRFGDKIIYAYAGLFVINRVLTTLYFWSTVHTKIMHNMPGYRIIYFIITPAILCFVQVLVWIMVAQVIRRIVPIIDEAKTLV